MLCNLVNSFDENESSRNMTIIYIYVHAFMNSMVEDIKSNKLIEY